MKNIYLDRFGWPGPLITQQPNEDLGIIVVIPSYNEPEVLSSLRSLQLCDLPDCNVEVIVVVNHSRSEDPKVKTLNIQSADQIEGWVESIVSSPITYHVIRAFDLDPKISGVGLARKIGMDEAVRRFEYLHHKKGIIVCYDADCICSTNYLLEIHNTYREKSQTNVALVYFEHPLEGDYPNEIYDGIINYELHLRYYKNALHFAKFPYSYHTIGSCITVTSEAYQKQGGMNKRKAGEDFYFLQKLFSLGHVENINSTTVIPSPRSSHRVPFGTGRAISNFRKALHSKYFTYNPKTFIELKAMFLDVGDLFDNEDLLLVIKTWPISIRKFIAKYGLVDKIIKIKNNSTNPEQFCRSFHQWFNGFVAMKYIHFTRDNFYKNVEILEASNWILSELDSSINSLTSKKEVLQLLRALDRSAQ